MKIYIHNRCKWYLPSVMEIRYTGDLYRLGEITTEDGKHYSKEFMDAIDHPFQFRNKSEIRQAISLVKEYFPNVSCAGLSLELHRRNARQMYRIIHLMGDKPFENPMSLWQEHVNEHGVIMPKNFNHKQWLEHLGFEILPYPMFMGIYDKDYTQVLVGLRKNNNGFVITPEEYIA